MKKERNVYGNAHRPRLNIFLQNPAFSNVMLLFDFLLPWQRNLVHFIHNGAAYHSLLF